MELTIKGVVSLCMSGVIVMAGAMYFLDMGTKEEAAVCVCMAILCDLFFRAGYNNAERELSKKKQS